MRIVIVAATISFSLACSNIDAPIVDYSEPSFANEPRSTNLSSSSSSSSGGSNAVDASIDSNEAGEAMTIDAGPSPECRIATDCASLVCSPEGKCIAATATDGVKNQGETDVDCGGPMAPACANTKKCAAGSDCTSLVCTGAICQAPTFTDGAKNGTETDVDCGGAGATGAAQKCATGKTCAAHADCKSDGCGDDNKCTDFRTCTQLHGGRTCGAGEFGGGAGTVHESCCAEAAVPTRPGLMLDKYLITAGRMRAFVERVGGNVRDAVRTNPKWVAEWTNYMPTNMTEALAQLGPWAMDWEWPSPGIVALPRTTWAARGCSVTGFGARTYWQPPIGAEANTLPKDTLDEKALNCVTAAMSLAMCLWDGKDLADPVDLTAAWVGNDNRQYPWGNAPVPPTVDNEFSPYVVHRYNYQWPNYAPPDATSFVAAPGRRPLGNGPYGHADLAGVVISQARRGSTTYFLSSGSWERHKIGSFGSAYTQMNGTAGDTVWNRRYYAIGARCARR